nr:myosin-11-like [Pogona vitticeps]
MNLLVRKVWSGSELSLLASLQEEMRRGSGWSKVGSRPRGEPQERNLELELNMMQFELFSLKQKMESSFTHLEREKKWLETNHAETRKPGGDLKDKTFHLEMELEKNKTYFSKRKPASPSTAPDSGPDPDTGKKNVGQELSALQESLATHKKRIKALEAKQKEMAQQLSTAKEGQRTAFSQISKAEHSTTNPPQSNETLREGERIRLRAAHSSICLEKVELHRQVQHLTSELECARKQQEGIGEQVSALHSELLNTKTQANHQEKEKVLMKEELELTTQVKEELSSEVTESRQRLEELLEKVHHLEAEKEILESHIQALENDQTQLLQEKEKSAPQNQTGDVPLQDGCGHHRPSRESQALLEKEKSLLQARCLELEEALHRKQEEMENQLAEQQQISKSWRDRWEQATAALKSKEEQSAETHRQSQTFSPKVEAPSLLQIQLDACKQELELERNRTWALHDQVQLLQSRSPSKPVPPNEDSQEEANPELAHIREELQKAQDVLKTRNVEIEEQRKELESTRRQCAECISEKEQLVASLEKQLEEKEQALRDLRQAKDVDRTQKENKMSALELKGRHGDWDAKSPQSPQRDQESLKLQHQLVTEQLKGLFRQREQNLQLTGSKKHPRGPQEQSSVAPQTSPGMPTTTEPISFPDGQPASLNVHYSKGEVQSLQEQLKEKTQTISTMASEIQELKQKNESLMKAKLRFQQQIQDIRRLSKQQPERSSAELVVARLHGSGAGLQSTQGTDRLLPSPQSEEPVLSSLPGQENLQPTRQEPELSTDAGKEQRGPSPDTFSASVPTLPLHSDPTLSGPAVPSIKLSLGTLTSLQDPESEGALLSPRGSILLSPKPFGSLRPWSPFKARGSPEPPED